MYWTVESATPGDGYFDDFYHQLMTSSWPLLLLVVVAVIVAVNCLFAAGYLIAGGVAHARQGSFADAFFFSVQTMATIGYGTMAPNSFVANLLASGEALTGLLAFALVTGLVFSKFSRPTARVRFTRNAVISLRDGVPSLMFRMANVRANQIVEAQNSRGLRAPGKHAQSRVRRCAAFTTWNSPVTAMQFSVIHGPRFIQSA